MQDNPEKHHRHSIRLKGYDYSRPGYYFITIVTHNRECLFGEVVDGEMKLNTFGKIVEYHWRIIPRHFPFTQLDEYQFMPNHMHGIIIITTHVGAMHSGKINLSDDNSVPENASPLQTNGNHHSGNAPSQRPIGTKPGSLSAIIQNFKSITTRKINRIRHAQGTHLWQRNYWEHIIRDENELNRIRHYIINNLRKWYDDRYFKE